MRRVARAKVEAEVDPPGGAEGVDMLRRQAVVYLQLV